MVEQQTHILPAAGSNPAPATTSFELEYDWPAPPSGARQAAAYAALSVGSSVAVAALGIGADALMNMDSSDTSPAFDARARAIVALGSVVGGAVLALPSAAIVAARPRDDERQHFITGAIVAMGGAVAGAAVGVGLLGAAGLPVPDSCSALYVAGSNGLGMALVMMAAVLAGLAVGIPYALCNPGALC